MNFDNTQKAYQLKKLKAALLKLLSFTTFTNVQIAGIITTIAASVTIYCSAVPFIKINCDW